MADLSNTLEDEFLDSGPDAKQRGEPVANAKSPTPQQLGKLLEEEDEAKVAETLEQWLRAQAKARKRRRVVIKRNELWMQGFRGVRLKAPDREDLTEIELHVPLGALELPPIMDRTDELVERVIAQLLADKPMPEAEPANDSDIAREAAEVTNRILTIEGSESGWNEFDLHRRAARKSAVAMSGFIYTCVDPTGGGWEPMEIKAHPQAQHKDQATKIVGPDGTPQDAPTDSLVTRYVMPDGTLTDDPMQADKQWKPRLVKKVLTPEQVAFLPEHASGLRDAVGVLIIDWPTVSEARAKFPTFAKLKDDEIRELLEWKPEEAKGSIPKDAPERVRSSTDGQLSDDARFCTLSLYFESHGAYPKGAYIVAAKRRVLHKQTWCAIVEDQGTKTVREECLDIPLAQARLLPDDVTDDPMGRALVDKLGPIDEVRATIVTAWLEYLDQSMHRHTFIPIGSHVQPGQVMDRNDVPIFFPPDGKPEWEEIPEFSRDGKEFFDRTTIAGNTAVGVTEGGDGSVTDQNASGVAKSIDVQHMQRNLATMRAGLADCIERDWMVSAQLIRAFFTVSQQLRYLGEDSVWRLKEWSRADLGNTRHIRIGVGSFTQMTPDQKKAAADALLQTVDPTTGARVIDFDEYRRIITGGIRPMLGLKDSPQTLRIKKQVSAWKDGPPKDFPVQLQRHQLATQNWQAAAAQAQAMGQQPPAAPVMATPFDRRPVDLDITVAKVRYQELAREMNGSTYGTKPPEWRQLFDAEFEAMRQAAGVPTMAEQQAAQQETQRQQQQAETQKTNAAHADKAADRAATAADSEASRAHEIDKLALQGEQAAQRESARASAQFAGAF